MLMTEKQITICELVEETLDYYWGHPERFGRNQNDGCVYRTCDGQYCAVGRCIDWGRLDMDMKWRIADFDADVASLHEEVDIHVQVKYRYSGIGVDYWDSLQCLHDRSYHWDDSANLTPEGYKYMRLAFSDFDIDYYLSSRGYKIPKEEKEQE